jgi:tRNA threonylcarbamoyladenosine biosynthesis protein TsaE
MRYALNVPTAALTQAIASELAQVLVPGAILWLEGNLGSGKTTFVQGLGRGLGITTAIVSPTFTLIDEYLDGSVPLYHVDLYRLEPSEVGSLHLSEYWSGVDFPLGIVAIEWADRLGKKMPSYLHISLSPLPTPTSDLDSAQIEQVGRQIIFTAVGAETQYVQAIAHLSNCFSHLGTVGSHI